MATIATRLRRGEPRWSEQLALRMLGVVALLASSRLAGPVRARVLAAPHHAPGNATAALCLGAIVLLAAGIALLLFGPGLFEHVPIPNRRR